MIFFRPYSDPNQIGFYDQDYNIRAVVKRAGSIEPYRGARGNMDYALMSKLW